MATRCGSHQPRDHLEEHRVARYPLAIRTFLYLHCSNLREAREFYTGVLGLPEIYFSAEEQSVGYHVGSTQITIGQHSVAHQVNGWSEQLGWQGGETANPSWGVQLESEHFQAAIDRALADGATTWQTEPAWVGYWSFPVRDPMGNTVELSAVDPSAWPRS